MCRWTFSLLSGLALVSHLSDLSAADAPRFQSLSPARQPSAWVQQLNMMNEAERRERVRTYGMPPAPPNRWLRNSEPTDAPVAKRPVVQQYSPAPTPKARPAVVKPKVLPVGSKAKTVTRISPKPQPKLRLKQPALIKPQPRPHESDADPSVERTTALRPIFTSKDKPMVDPEVLSTEPKPKQSLADALRKRMAFMPQKDPAKTANPYAPYASKAEYRRALARTTWKPKSKLASPKPNRIRLRWPFAKRSALASSKPTLNSRAQEGPQPSRSGANVISRLKFTYASNGLPQPGRSRGRKVIETSLFPR